MPQTEALRSITSDTRALLRARMDADPWYFAKFVCKRAAKAVERIHRPLLYLYTGHAALLAATLDDPRFDSHITQQVKADFGAQTPPIDWNNPAHLPRMKARLRRVRISAGRGLGKSTFADVADLFDGVIDPNITIGIGSKSDPYAESRVIAIGEMVLSKEFAFWYPERVPLNPRTDITAVAIELAGRTEVTTEATIEGRGITSQWRGRHYRKLRPDDIAGTEYGEASIEDAVAFISGIDAIQVREAFGESREIYIGTISGENDDHTYLAADPGVMMIVMPIEIHEGGTTVENIFTDGVLTMPEEGWFTREKVNDLKRKARANEDHLSLRALLQNFYMTLLRDGGANLFTPTMLNAAKGIIWHFDKDLQREVLLIPKKGREKTQRDRSKPDFNADDWKLIDIAALPASARAWAADQSVSPTGDPWAFAYIVRDWEGVDILIACVTGNGYDKLIDEAPRFDKKCGFPRQIGIDTNATQGMTVEWMGRTPEYQAMARRLVEMKSSGEAKDHLIRRWIAGRMLSGDFYVNPRLVKWLFEASRYAPRKPDGTLKRNSIDDQLDATQMACQLPKRPPSPQQIEEDSARAALERARGMVPSGASGGIDKSNWMECMWNAA